MDSGVRNPVSKSSPVLPPTKEAEKNQDNLQTSDSYTEVKETPTNPQDCSNSSANLTDSSVSEGKDVSSTDGTEPSDPDERSPETSVQSEDTSPIAEVDDSETESTLLRDIEEERGSFGRLLGMGIFSGVLLCTGIIFYDLALKGIIPEVYGIVGLSVSAISAVLAIISGIYVFTYLKAIAFRIIPIVYEQLTRAKTEHSTSETFAEADMELSSSNETDASQVSINESYGAPLNASTDMPHDASTDMNTEKPECTLQSKKEN